jgi:hypothetical protein
MWLSYSEETPIVKSLETIIVAGYWTKKLNRNELIYELPSSVAFLVLQFSQALLLCLMVVSTLDEI